MVIDLSFEFIIVNDLSFCDYIFLSADNWSGIWMLFLLELFVILLIFYYYVSSILLLELDLSRYSVVGILDWLLDITCCVVTLPVVFNFFSVRQFFSYFNYNNKIVTNTSFSFFFNSFASSSRRLSVRSVLSYKSA
jgi:hypothetical protein